MRQKSKRNVCGVLACIGVMAGIACAHAEDAKQFALTIKDHKFTPASLTVPANEKFDLIVTNADTAIEEFESADFHVEKVIGAGKSVTFQIGPLTKGEYGFFGDYHQDTALGRLFVE